MELTFIDAFAKCTFLSFATHTFSQAVTAFRENYDFSKKKLMLRIVDLDSGVKIRIYKLCCKYTNYYSHELLQCMFIVHITYFVPILTFGHTFAVGTYIWRRAHFIAIAVTR